jgi:hypothetical protein
MDDGCSSSTCCSMGYNVNYYTLELGEDYVGKRFDCYFTGYSIEDVNKHRGEVEKIVAI